MKPTFEFKKLSAEHDQSLARIIRSCLEEFNAAKPGTVYYDSSTDHLSSLFSKTGSDYFIAEVGGTIVGGAGFYPTEGLSPDTCELVKLYLIPQVRNMGLGKALMRHCEAAAKAAGYKNIYLETMPELHAAVPLYLRMGYVSLPEQLGNSGHSGCSIWMITSL